MFLCFGNGYRKPCTKIGRSWFVIFSVIDGKSAEMPQSIKVAKLLEVVSEVINVRFSEIVIIPEN